MDRFGNWIKSRVAEAIVVLCICGFLVIGMVWWAKRPCGGPITATRIRIASINQLVLEYKKTNGHLPAQPTWRKDIAGSILEKDHYLFIDGWGMELQYKLFDDGNKFIIYSVGPNKIDESGAGDDISDGAME